jgi:hypothetical protein
MKIMTVEQFSSDELLIGDDGSHEKVSEPVTIIIAGSPRAVQEVILFYHAKGIHLGGDWTRPYPVPGTESGRVFRTTKKSIPFYLVSGYEKD